MKQVNYLQMKQVGYLEMKQVGYLQMKQVDLWQMKSIRCTWGASGPGAISYPIPDSLISHTSTTSTTMRLCSEDSSEAPGPQAGVG